LQTDIVNHGLEYCPNTFKKQWFSSQRNEYVVIEGSMGAAVFEITFESNSRSFVQGYKATFTKFGTSNN